MKHKHYDCIVAWAEGKDIEYYSSGYRGWIVVNNPAWDEDTKYRIKKEPVIEVKYFQVTEYYHGKVYNQFNPDLEPWHLKITYQDGKAIKAELPDEK